MSTEKLDDACPGCKPVIVDVKTGLPLPPSDPIAQAVDKLWETTTLEEREAFHRLSCLNDSSDENRSKLQYLYDRIGLAIKKAKPAE
jgi:hypothetical protein